jgi:hypothetical protein
MVRFSLSGQQQPVNMDTAAMTPNTAASTHDNATTQFLAFSIVSEFHSGACRSPICMQRRKAQMSGLHGIQWTRQSALQACKFIAQVPCSTRDSAAVTRKCAIGSAKAVAQLWRCRTHKTAKRICAQMPRAAAQNVKHQCKRGRTSFAALVTHDA